MVTNDKANEFSLFIRTGCKTLKFKDVQIVNLMMTQRNTSSSAEPPSTRREHKATIELWLSMLEHVSK